MDPLTISVASGLRSRMETLDMLANNLANAATSGFKSDREFYGLYVSPEAQASAAEGAGLPTTVPVIEKQWTDFSQGLLLPTGNSLDMAITGQGFFTATSTSGPVYTRNGSFRLSSSGVLVTADGYPVQGQGGKPIQSQSDGRIEVLPDGELRQDGQTLGKLNLVEFSDKSAVVKQGNNYFRLADPKAKPAPASAARVEQGKLEGSNAAAAEGAVRLVGVMRQFEMLQKAMSLGSDMDKHVIEEVARVGS